MLQHQSRPGFFQNYRLKSLVHLQYLLNGKKKWKIVVEVLGNCLQVNLVYYQFGKFACIIFYFLLWLIYQIIGVSYALNNLYNHKIDFVEHDKVYTIYQWNTISSSSQCNEFFY